MIIRRHKEQQSLCWTKQKRYSTWDWNEHAAVIQVERRKMVREKHIDSLYMYRHGGFTARARSSSAKEEKKHCCSYRLRWFDHLVVLLMVADDDDEFVRTQTKKKRRRRREKKKREKEWFIELFSHFIDDEKNTQAQREDNLMKGRERESKSERTRKSKHIRPVRRYLPRILRMTEEEKENRVVRRRTFLFFFEWPPVRYARR